MTGRRAIFAACLLALGCAPEESRSPAPPSDPTVDTAAPSLFTSSADADWDRIYAAAIEGLAQRLEPNRFDPVDTFDVRRLIVDDVPLAHVHLQQTHAGVPVFGGEVLVHLFDSGAVRAVTDDLVPGLSVDPNPLTTADEAVAIADAAPPSPLWDRPPSTDGEEAGLGLSRAPEVELWVIRRDGVDRLVWSVQLHALDAKEPTMPRVFVDAHTGEEVWRYENLQTIQINQPTRYDGTQAVDVHVVGATKYLEDPVRNYVSIDFRNTSTSLWRITTTAATFPDTTEASLHYGTRAVEDYYFNVQGRNGIDGLGGPGFITAVATGLPALTGAAHFSVNYNNAFWDSVNGLFISGDGNGVSFSPLVSVDVIGHEFTHGVTQYTAGLIYADESGALNESLSDVMGAAVEAERDALVSANTWKIGEDCYTPFVAGDALRYMADPTLDGSSSDHYADRYVGPLDNGGVHWNSGIGNLAFYLASQGGNHPFYGGTAITGIGIGSAELIWYQALTGYATASTDFHGFRVATLLAAEDLFGLDSVEQQTVDAAWELVGVDPWVLRPSGWAASGVGSPAVVYRKPTGDLVMAFETMVVPPDDDCPSGQWSIGIATSTDGNDFSYVGAAAVLSPSAGTYRSCVVAHPTMMLDAAGTGFDLWFKAEQDLTTCAGNFDCLFTGIGYAHLASDLLTIDTVSAAPVVVTSEVMGFPSVIQSNGTYVMALQRHPDLFVATSPAPSGPWTLDPTPVMSPGVVSYSEDELFNPALVCEGDDAPLPPFPYSNYFGGRDRDTVWGTILDGGLGQAISADATNWLLGVNELYGFDDDLKWRHWSALRHGTGLLVYFSETVGGANRIGLQTDLTSWSKDGLSSRTCPQPVWW